jgi:hypothetical protein
MYGNNHCRTIKAHLRKSLAWARFVAQVVEFLTNSQVQTPVPQKKKKNLLHIKGNNYQNEESQLLLSNLSINNF